MYDYLAKVILLGPSSAGKYVIFPFLLRSSSSSCSCSFSPWNSDIISVVVFFKR